MVTNARTTEPTVEPVTAAEVDSYLRGDGELEAADEAELEALIASAREYVELQTRRALITQTWTMYLDCWPRRGPQELEWWDGVREGAITQIDPTGSVELPIGPLQSVVHVKTYDQSNVATTMDSDQYFLDRLSVPGTLNLNTGVSWPVFTRNKNGIEIQYIAGYGDSAADVPHPLCLAIKMLAAHWYENREFVKTQSDQNQAPSPLHVQSILNRYKVFRL
jgi:uncharacterized phiE125 gp8 family phage protein